MIGYEVNRGRMYPHVLGSRWALVCMALCTWGAVEETVPVPVISGLLPLCCRNVSSVRNGGKELPAAVCSVLTAVAQLPSM